MHISQMTESKFLKRSDCGEDGIILTIAGIERENVAKKGEDPEHKYILSWKEDAKPMVLNRINTEKIARITGSEDTDDWPGHQIIAYDDPEIEFGGKLVGGIRVRAAKKKVTGPARPAGKAAPSPVTEDEEDVEVF